MKSILVLVSLFSFFSLQAQISLEQVRKSRKVKDYITLSVHSEKSITFKVDERNVPKTLDAIDFFQVKDKEFWIRLNFQNPMKYRISTSNKELDDELQKAALDFVSTSVDFLSQNSSLQNAASARGISGFTDASGNAQTLEGPLAEAHFLAERKVAAFFNIRNTLENAMYELDLAENESKFSDDLNAAFDVLAAITKIDEIADQIDNEDAFKTALKNYVSTASKNLEALEKEIGKEPFTGHDDLKRIFDHKLKAVQKDFKEFEAAAKDLIEKYSIILSHFKKIHAEKIEGLDNQYALKKLIKLEKSKRQELTITVEKLKFDGTKKTLSVEATQKYLLHIRRTTTFIPVVSSGVIYTNLSFPQFGTSEDANGATILTQTASEDNEIAIGAYLNLYVNNNWDVPVFAQFGVGPSKEKPLFFLGGGFSLYDRITISAGTVFTWFPELNELTLGQQIDGTSVIEDDLVYKFITSPKFYLGLSFNITKKE